MAVSPFVGGMLAKWSSLSSIFDVDAALYLLVLSWVWWRMGNRTSSG